MQIILYPAIVQGEAAAESIVKGIRALEKFGVDVMIVGRGGGSMEDLWAFNERIVAQAVFDCSIPIISAVGHETDTTIIDYVSDLRAPTPSAAAELAVMDVRQLDGALAEYRDRLQMGIQRKIRSRLDRLKQYERQLALMSPASRIRADRTKCMQLEERLQEKMQLLLKRKRLELQLYIERLRGLSPLEKLNSGFSYVEDMEGCNIRSVSQVSLGQGLRIQVSDGVICTEVKGMEERKNDE